MFYIIQFDNIESEETKQLQFELCQYPNGTILSYAQHIKVPILPTDKWIVWIEHVYKYEEQYEQFLKIKGIKNFNALDIVKSPCDIDWLWNDDYINNIFADCVKSPLVK
jgi:hypothetical protein